VSVKDGVSAGVRLIKMTVELHRRGYQRLRICPYEHMSWRVEFGPSSAFSPRNGAYMRTRRFFHADGTSENATYSGADGFRYFDWDDAQHYDAEKLAGVFVSRFPIICTASEGRDWEYVGWLSELSGYASRSRRLPFVVAEYFEPAPEKLTYIPLRDYEGGGENEHFPLPPAVNSNDREIIRERDGLRERVEQMQEKINCAIKILK
jgi:hypothetical protein